MSTLTLVPTAREREILGLDAHLCGFGPVAAAARTAGLIAAYKPTRVILAGIAGSYDLQRFPPGQATRFEAVAIDGIGAGAGAGFVPASQMGFPHWPGDQGTPRLGDRIHFDPEATGLLVTVCAAAGSDDEVAARLARHPGALAEDMEGYGVATACALAAVPLSIIRGASNRAGDRNVRGWCIREALDEVGRLLRAWPDR